MRSLSVLGGVSGESEKVFCPVCQVQKIWGSLNFEIVDKKEGKNFLVTHRSKPRWQTKSPDIMQTADRPTTPNENCITLAK